MILVQKCAQTVHWKNSSIIRCPQSGHEPFRRRTLILRCRDHVDPPLRRARGALSFRAAPEGAGDEDDLILAALGELHVEDDWDEGVRG